MFKTISDLFHNPVYGPMIAIWITGVSAFLLRDFPKKLLEFFTQYFTVSLTITDSGYSSITNHYNSFLKWALSQKGIGKLSRNFVLKTTDTSIYEDQDKSSTILGIGYGLTFFLYKKRLFWIHQYKLDSSGSERVKTEITIRGLSRNKKILEDMIAEFQYKKNSEELSSYEWEANSKQWEILSVLPKRNIKSVILKKDIKEKLISDIDFFLTNREWYESRGLNYKTSIILEGPPGTGKTSTIKALASYFDKEVYIINLNMMNDSSFPKALSSVKKGSFVVIEDFDSVDTTHSRTEQKEKTSNEDNTLSLTTILNTLDGIVALDGIVIFLTTNHITKIDEALIRKGRIDNIFKIGYLGNTEIKEQTNVYFPEENIELVTASNIPGCDVQSYFLESRGDYKKYLELLNKS